MKIHFGQIHDKIREINVECDYCGNVTKQYAKNNDRNDHNFCNMNCYGNWRSENLNGENNPKYRRIQTSCENCKSELELQENIIDRNDNHFCNKDCYTSWMINGDERSGLYYGDNWDKITSKIRERDGICKGCKISNEKCVKKYGCQLHVHHIKPLRTFSNISKANDLENLIALCPKCHREREYEEDT